METTCYPTLPKDGILKLDLSGSLGVHTGVRTHAFVVQSPTPSLLGPPWGIT